MFASICSACKVHNVHNVLLARAVGQAKTFLLLVVSNNNTLVKYKLIKSKACSQFRAQSWNEKKTKVERRKERNGKDWRLLACEKLESSAWNEKL